MSTERIDSMAIYADANRSLPLIPANQASLLRRWTTVSGGNTETGTAWAEHDSALLLDFGGAVTVTLQRKSKWIIGFRYKFHGDLAKAGGAVWSFQNCTLGNAFTLCRLFLNTDGTFTLYSGNGITIINTSLAAISPDVSYYIEMVVEYTGTTNINVQADLYLDAIHITGGNANSGINMVSLLSNSATSNIHAVTCGAGAAGPEAYIQDIYIFDGEAPVNNAPILNPALTIGAIHENGDVVQQLVRSAGTTNFNLVNENPEDADTTYVESGTVPNQDIYDWEDIMSFTGQIPCVQLSICGRKTDEDGRAFQSVVGDNGGIVQSDSFYLSNDFHYYPFEMDLDPSTNLPWTVNGFNLMRFGQRVSV